MDKHEWPEVVGQNVEEAKVIILNHDATISVQFVPEGSMVTMDFREDRVRVFHDAANKVTQPPRRG
ncbi:hypothetical protein pb186bvf_000299 [Paramecium bursaria]